ncbi:MAG TPA: hypothetical protein VFR39_09625 [Burkholderiales bacterium]|nr:hypothetical protein [Burkholderiales bacterium]
MRSRIIVVGFIWWIVLFAAMLTAGCSRDVPAQGPAATRAGHASLLRDGIRFRRDEVRNRIWLLGFEDVRIYDATNERLIRRVTLPNWSVARYACDPDMILDESGSAIISSNVQARLWRIDGGSFTVSERDITLHERENWDVGFAALAPAGNGKLLALTTLAGSSWNVDIDKGIAHMAAPAAALQSLCGLTAQKGYRP